MPSTHLFTVASSLQLYIAQCAYVDQLQYFELKVLGWLMSCSCHLDRALNVEIGVECQVFVIVIFFNCGQVLHFGAHSRYYKCALTQRDNF